jgi:preprotein translocase subunit YajC
MSLNLETIMLQTAGSPIPGALMMVAMIAVMYFFLIRPQSKRAKEQKKFADSINPGDRIVTTAGIHGRISQVNDDGTLKVEVNHGTFITIERSAISMDLTSGYRKRTEGANTTNTPTATK